MTLNRDGKLFLHPITTAFWIESRCFIAALELLEAFDYHSSTFTELNWSWIFETIVPWLAIAIILAKASFAPRTEDTKRAHKQIDIVFNRYSDPSAPLSSTPMWQLLVQLRQRFQPQYGQEKDITEAKVSVDTTRQPMESSEMIYADDLMLDFGLAPQQDTNLYDDELIFQEVQDFPWYAVQLSNVVVFEWTLKVWL